MMGYGNFGLMGLGGGLFFYLFWLILLIDMVLFGVWMFKQIQKK